MPSISRPPARRYCCLKAPRCQAANTWPAFCWWSVWWSLFGSSLSRLGPSRESDRERADRRDPTNLASSRDRLYGVIASSEPRCRRKQGREHFFARARRGARRGPTWPAAFHGAAHASPQPFSGARRVVESVNFQSRFNAARCVTPSPFHGTSIHGSRARYSASGVLAGLSVCETRVLREIAGYRRELSNAVVTGGAAGSWRNAAGTHECRANVRSFCVFGEDGRRPRGPTRRVSAMARAVRISDCACA
jgi:hypothetical protein